MKRKIPFLLLILLVVYVGESKAQKEEIKPDPTGKAIVYFYSLAAPTTLGRIKAPVFLDDREIAAIRPERFFIVLVEPGKHAFRLKNKKFGGIEREFEVGKTYFLRIGWEEGGIVRPNGISRVEPDSGAYDVRQLRPVDKGNIKDKKIVFLKLPE